MNFKSELYSPGDSNNWSGRTDSETDFDQFRYHQVVNCMSLNDLSDTTQKTLLGFASDIGVKRNKGRVGAAKGPQHFRNNIGSLSWHGDPSGFIDAGNITPEGDKMEEAQQELGKAVHHILESENTPIIIGGGHETAYGHFLGIASYLQQTNPKAKLGILNIDAHFDLRPYTDFSHSGSPFLQAHDYAKKTGLDLNYFVYGINQDNNTRSLFKKVEELDSEYCLNTEIFADEFSSLNKVLQFIESRDFIYLTICLDVFEAALAPGVSAPSWNGIKINHALKLIELVKESGKLFSTDICELNPGYDLNNQTAKTAGTLFSELIR